MYLFPKNFLCHLGLSTVCLLSIVSCSNGNEKVVASNTHNIENKTKTIILRHIHPENECLKAIIHRHSNGRKDHEHPQSCEKKSRSYSNAHSHKGNNATGSLRHVHSNGYKKHSHRR